MPVERQLVVSQVETDNDLEVRAGNRRIGPRDDDVFKGNRLPRDLLACEIRIHGEVLLGEHFRAAARHCDPVAIFVAIGVRLWPLTEGKVQFEIGTQRLVIDIAAEQADAIQLTCIGDVAEVRLLAFLFVPVASPREKPRRRSLTF